MYTRKFILTSVLIILISNSLLGQNKYSHLYKDNNVDMAAKKISMEISKKPDDIELNFDMALLLINRQYTEYNPTRSYEYLMKSKQYFDNTTNIKTLEKLNKIPLNQSIYQDYTDSVCRYALDDVIKQNRIESYQNYLDLYKTAPSYQRNNAIERKNKLAFLQAYQTNTTESYQSFIDNYPDAEQKNAAVEERNALVFTKVAQLDNIQAYKDFISKYKNAKEIHTALERIYALSFDEALKINTAAGYKRFIDTYPESKQYQTAFELFEKKQFSEYIAGAIDSHQYVRFIEEFPESSMKTTAMDSALIIIQRTKDLDAAKYCFDNFQNSDKNQALLLYHDMFTNDGEKQTLDLFYKNFDDEYLSDVKQKDYTIAELGDRLLLELPYDSARFSDYDSYIQQAAPKEKAFVALQRLISPYIAGKSWDIAAKKVKSYAQYFGPQYKKINDLIDLLERDIDSTIKTSLIGPGVNTIKGGEYVPVISADDKLLYFCGRERKDNIGGEDIFVSKKIKGIWTKAKIISDLSSKFSNDAPLSISTDGTSMLLFKSGEILYSEKTKQGWSESIRFPEQINGGKWQADAMISSDGKALVFASTKSGGYNLFTEVSNFHGDNQYSSDIYVSTLNENNEWDLPINLGKVINTPYCERSPFLHPDMKTLYFSSDGHGGLGKLDVYKSTRLADSCWNCWSEPINMGKEFNTQESDWSYKISTNGQVAYFSKTNNVSNSEDIYTVNIPSYLQPDLVATVSGKLVDKDNQPIVAEIRWEDLETGKIVGQSKSDPTDGSFFIVLPVGKIYGYFVDEDQYFPISNHIDLRKNKKTTEVEENINMVTFKQMADDGSSVPVNNLFFNFSESVLLPYSFPELKRVASIIKANHLKVEISGHTDNIGNDEMNQTLSEQRALAVRNFLINEGCVLENLIIKGYGKTKPVSTNETEEGRAKNRRVELKLRR